MSEERLNEIKDSIDFQLRVCEIQNYETDMIIEEKELYNEVLSNKMLIQELRDTIDNQKEEIDRLNKELGIFQRENDLLKHKLNDIAFGDDSELALRFLRRIGYVGFDEKRKVYINKHNNEPFLWKNEQEKDYYLKDEELNDYTHQLEYKVDRLNNIINRARRKLGEYKYYSTPTEEQNKGNEDITDEVYQILHGNLYELKENNKYE